MNRCTKNETCLICPHKGDCIECLKKRVVRLEACSDAEEDRAIMAELAEKRL